MTDVVYPTGCRPLTEDLGPDELIRRLKSLANILQALGQDDDVYQQYIPLALHLADDYFLQHTSKDVQLLVACCIADLLRIYAPEAPYKNQEDIKTIFLFFIQQLHGLRDPKDPTFKRYFYLLENLAYVKTFNMSFDLEDCQEILCELFEMIFKIVNEHHSAKVKNFMIDILRPLITEADNFTMELLDLILINIIEPNKSNNRHAYQLAETLILKTSDSLEPVIKMFFNQVLVMDKVDKKLSISNKVYDLIYELYIINPILLCSILPQMECKLKANDEDERLKAVTLLARMFSEKDSELIQKQPALLKVFLGRFCDISLAVRVKCVQSAMHFLLHHPYLRNEIVNNLKARQHDSEETVRYEVVMSIIETAKRDFSIIMEYQELLSFVKERMLDKKYRIRKEALTGLSWVYRQAICEIKDITPEQKSKLDWIKNKVLHGYYMPALEDRLLVERLLITSLVPYKLPPEERMMKLYRLLGTLDDHATKAFIELQKNQMKIRKTVGDWVKLHSYPEMTPKIQNQLNIKQGVICKLLPDPQKAKEHIIKFSNTMRKDQSIVKLMETILKRDVSCKECADSMSHLLKRFGAPVSTNTYYNTIKVLIERISSVMVDKESLIVLVNLIEKCMNHSKIIEELGLSRFTAGEQGLKILCTLSYVFAPHFFDSRILRHMVSLLSYDEEYVAPLILKSLTHLGRYRSLRDEFPDILTDLAPICKDFALNGDVKQAKHAVRCMFVNSQIIRSSDPEYVKLANANAAIKVEPAPPKTDAAGNKAEPSGNNPATNQIVHATADSSSDSNIAASGTAVSAAATPSAGTPQYKPYLSTGLPPDCSVPLLNQFPNNEVVPPSGIISVHPIFGEIIDILRSTLMPNCDNQRTKVVTLGHIAYNMPQAFPIPIKNMIARRIVKDLLIQAGGDQRECDSVPEGNWCSEDELPIDTLCKMEALKAMARWLIGLQNDELAAQKTFRMLNAFVNQRGDLLEQNIISAAEKSWLRLAAACAILKICEQKGVGDQYSPDHYYSLSSVMYDPVPEVRQKFASKLHKGLGKCMPNKCLPLDFMGYYVLAGHETDRKIIESIRHYIDSDIVRRREYVRTITSSKNFEPSENQVLHILPDFMLAFAVPILAQDPHFRDPTDFRQLKQMEKCLRFILDPLMSKREQFSYSFYKNVVELMKNHELIPTQDEDENLLNIKMWTLCDLAMYVINSKISQMDSNCTAFFDVKIKLPAMYFKLASVENFQNNKIYIPLDKFTNVVTKPKPPTIPITISNGAKRSSSTSSSTSNGSSDYGNENGISSTAARVMNTRNPSLTYRAKAEGRKMDHLKEEAMSDESSEPASKKPRVLRPTK